MGARKGTPSQAAGYCRKGEREKPKDSEGGWAKFAPEKVENNEHWIDGGEFGVRAKDPKPGERIDVSEFRDAIKRGSSDAELLEGHVGCVAKYQKMIGFTRAAYSKQLDKLPAGTRKDMGIWVWGPTDTDKSTQTPVDVFDKGSNKWWDGYMGEDVVLIDDPLRVWSQCNAIGATCQALPSRTSLIKLRLRHVVSFHPKASRSTRRAQ
jgi:hypothetical protein